MAEFEENVEVDWQLKCTRLENRARFLLETGRWADCTFNVGSDHQFFRAHKFILSMASPVFETMFHGSIPEKDGPIIIEDVNAKSFNALLCHVYMNKLELTAYVDACNLIYAAKKYMMPYLVRECVNYLSSNLTGENFCYIYECAQLFDESLLIMKCIRYMKAATKIILQDRNIETAKIDTLLTLFSQDELAIDSELDLFNAAMRYYEAQEKLQICTKKAATRTRSKKRKCAEMSAEATEKSNNNQKAIPNTKNGETSYVDEEKTAVTNTENVKVMVRGLVKEIRFLTMTSMQFASGPARSPLLTEAESFAILMNIVKKDCGVPLPDGLSNSRKDRKQSAHLDDDSVSEEELPIELEGRQLYSHLYSHLFCRRTITTEDCMNQKVLECSVTLTVDKNIIIHGVQIPTQVPQCVLTKPVAYPERVYAELQHEDGTRITFANYTNRVLLSTVMEIIFNRPVYLLRNKTYRILVEYQKPGWYPVGPGCQHIFSNGINFNFNIKNQRICVRNGTIQTIVFSLKPIKNAIEAMDTGTDSGDEYQSVLPSD